MSGTDGARRLDIDRARGLAILLVVFGHLVARQDPEGVSWYEPLRHAVYLFHMPFFFYLSGIVAFLAHTTHAPIPWGRLVGRRAKRLLLPFLAFGVLIVLAKRALAPALTVDNVPQSIGAGLGDLIWHTGNSPALSVWYLGVLFVFSIMTPLLMNADGGRPRLAAYVSILLFVLAMPPIAYLDRICGYYIFYIAGMLAAQAGEQWSRLLDRGGVFWLIPLGFFLVLAGRIEIDAHDYRWFLLAAGLLSMPALHAFVRVRPANGSSWLLFFGQYSFVIYLLNTIFIGLTKGVLLHVAPWDGANFTAFAVALMLAGVAGPVLAKRLVFRHLPALDRMTD